MNKLYKLQFSRFRHVLISLYLFFSMQWSSGFFFFYNVHNLTSLITNINLHPQCHHLICFPKKLPKQDLPMLKSKNDDTYVGSLLSSGSAF